MLSTRTMLIIGHGRHGKDKFAAYTGIPNITSSWAAAENVVYPAMRDRYASVEECWADRGNCRSEWFELIAAYNQHDPARLARDIYAQVPCYVGMRNRREFEGAVSVFSPLVIWVDRSEHAPPEPSSSMELGESDAHITVNNNRDLNHLWDQATTIRKLFGYRLAAEEARRERLLEHG